MIPKENEIIINLIKDFGHKTRKAITTLDINFFKSLKAATIADLILCYF